MTPYQLRFEIFKQAYDMLCDTYHAEVAKAELSNGGTLPQDFDVKYPSLSDVLNQASVINKFISENN